MVEFFNENKEKIEKLEEEKDFLILISGNVFILFVIFLVSKEKGLL